MTEKKLTRRSKKQIPELAIDINSHVFAYDWDEKRFDASIVDTSITNTKEVTFGHLLLDEGNVPGLFSILSRGLKSKEDWSYILASKTTRELIKRAKERGFVIIFIEQTGCSYNLSKRLQIILQAKLNGIVLVATPTRMTSWGRMKLFPNDKDNQRDNKKWDSAAIMATMMEVKHDENGMFYFTGEATDQVLRFFKERETPYDYDPSLKYQELLFNVASGKVPIDQLNDKISEIKSTETVPYSRKMLHSAEVEFRRTKNGDDDFKLFLKNLIKRYPELKGFKLDTDSSCFKQLVFRAKWLIENGHTDISYYNRENGFHVYGRRNIVRASFYRDRLKALAGQFVKSQGVTNKDEAKIAKYKKMEDKEWRHEQFRTMQREARQIFGKIRDYFETPNNSFKGLI